MKWPFGRSPTWEDVLKEGWKLGSAGDIVGAGERFRAAIAMAPEEPNPYYQLGVCYLLRKEYAKAVAPFKKADRLSQGFFITQTYASLCEQVVSGAISPETANLLYALQVHVDNDILKTSNGLALARRVVELAPTCALAHYYLGKALFESNRADSEAALQRCLELQPDDTTAIDALTHVGFHREAAGDLAAARALWQTVLDRYPKNIHTPMTRMVMDQRFGAA